jgi:RNA polymerase sigma factor (sigma-70 family)
MKKVTSEEIKKAQANRDNINVMNKICSKYIDIIPYEELERCKLIALWHSIEKYDPSKGNCKFTSFLCNRLFWECQKQLYEINKARRIPRNEYASSLISDISGFEKDLDEVEFLELIEKLDEESQRIIFKRFYESKTTKEIGKENGYGRETARRRIIDAVDKLKQLCLPS